MALVDIDGFKRVNDVAGHATGDIVLAFVAACCADGLRRNDLIGRLGGDEFCIVMPSTELDAAVMVAERLRTLLRRAMKERPPARVDITLSIGVAAARSDDPAFGAVVARADRALLQAKSEGRDRVVVADMPA